MLLLLLVELLRKWCYLREAVHLMLLRLRWRLRWRLEDQSRTGLRLLDMQQLQWRSQAVRVLRRLVLRLHRLFWLRVVLYLKPLLQLAKLQVV